MRLATVKMTANNVIDEFYFTIDNRNVYGNIILSSFLYKETFIGERRRTRRSNGRKSTF